MGRGRQISAERRSGPATRAHVATGPHADASLPLNPPALDPRACPGCRFSRPGSPTPCAAPPAAPCAQRGRAFRQGKIKCRKSNSQMRSAQPPSASRASARQTTTIRSSRASFSKYAPVAERPITFASRTVADGKNNTRSPPLETSPSTKPERRHSACAHRWCWAVIQPPRRLRSERSWTTPSLPRSILPTPRPTRRPRPTRSG